VVDFTSLMLVLIGSFLGAVGTLFIKKGTSACSFWKLWRTKYFWGGMFLYVFSTLFYVIALRSEELSVVYPLVSTTYIFTTYLSVKYLGEKMNKWKWIGLIGIIVGVVLIGIGS